VYGTFHKQFGLLAVLLSRQAEDHTASLTIWEDRGAVEAVKSSPSYRRVVRELPLPLVRWRNA
jgi:heme-degrading monooxygenase HmoA